jgi:predicted amidohydrolase
VTRRRAPVGASPTRRPLQPEATGGQELAAVFTVGPLSFGIMICNDSNYPELATDMVARGAKAIFLPSNNSLPPERANVVASSRAVDIARARDNEVMIVRADVAGRTADRVSFGSSAIVDARGTVLRTGEALSEDILVAEVHASP